MFRSLRFNVLVVICLVAIIALEGCGHTEKIVYKTENVLIAPPDELIVKCSSTNPPDKVAFITAKPEQQIKLLTDNSTEQMGNLNKCASTVESIRQWKVDQLKIFTKDKPKTN